MEDEKLLVPGKLKLKIIEIQAREHLEWYDAAEKAADMLESRGFEKMVKIEVDQRFKKDLMTQLNKMRQGIHDAAYKEVLEKLRTDEDNFKVPCSKCGKWIYFSSRDASWETAKKVLLETFKNWIHGACE